MAPGSQVGLTPAVSRDLQMSIKIYGWGRSWKFPELAPFFRVGQLQFRGREGGEGLPSSKSSIPLIAPLPVCEAQWCPSFRNTCGD